LHEHSALPLLQRVANTLFRVSADRLIFTTEYEASAFGASPQSPIIPIGSNVPVHPGEPDRHDTVLYFGQLRPGKGIETFLDFAELCLAAGEPTRFVIIGSAPPRWRDYYRSLRALAPSSLNWLEDASFADVAEAMATARAAFLPFPDGAGLRRGSLLAALSNGLPVIAPFGESTTADLRHVLLPADTPEAALHQLRALRATPGLQQQYGEAGRALVRRFGWAAIAEEHLATYRSALASPADLRSRLW
jgi:glycosyltransferase involved in cell wall biosynthesis